MDGLGRAEEAVRANPRDAVAHFAVFWNLGKRLEMERHGVGLFATLGDLHRVQLPRLFGGDPREGEGLLRRAVALDPDDPLMRLMLANVSQAAGHR